MVSARLLSTLAFVLFISDGALSQDCAYESTNMDFCVWVSMGKHENDNILPILNERPFHGTEKQEEYKKGISDANQKLLEVLKKTETNELLVALKEALAAEGSVLSKVKDFCNGDKRSDRRCAEVVQRFADAIDALVRGVSELPLESSMRQTISEAYTNYEDEYYGSENSDYAQLALTLAETVAAALPSQN